MTLKSRHNLLRTSLILLAVVDVLALASFVFNQWFGVSVWHALGFAGLLALPTTMLVLPAVDAVLDVVDREASVPFAGEKIPGVGQ